MKLQRSIIAVVALVVAAGFGLPVRATAGDGTWWVPRLREKQVAQSGADKPEEEAPASTPSSPAAQAPANPPAAPAAAAATTAAGTAVAEPPAPPPPPLPDGSLLKTCSQLRKTPLGKEPNPAAYLTLVEAGKASAPQVNDFAAYLAKRGAVNVALQFQEYATELAPTDPTIWLNLGTIQRTAGNLGAAASAFKKSIALNPTSGLAHYNLGAVYDADGSYDDAIEEYRRALVLDPDLADPRKNPQVVNNENILAVKLKIYEDQAGALGLPLLQMQKPVEPPKNAAPAAKTPEKK